MAVVAASIKPAPTPAPSRPYPAMNPAAAVVVVRSVIVGRAKEPPAVPESQSNEAIAVKVSEVCSAEAYAAEMRAAETWAAEMHAARAHAAEMPATEMHTAHAHPAEMLATEVRTAHAHPPEMLAAAKMWATVEMHAAAAPAMAVSSGQCGTACKAGEAYQRDCREQRSRHTPHDFLPKDFVAHAALTPRTRRFVGADRQRRRTAAPPCHSRPIIRLSRWIISARPL